MFRFDIGDGAELRLLERRHAASLFALTDRSRSHLRRWLPFLDGTRTVNDTRRFIDEGLKQFAAGDGCQAGLWVNGQIAGAIGYHWIDWPHRVTSIGYWLGEDFQRRGLMTAACRAFVDHALLELRLNRVVINCAADNHRSRAIPERLGFLREGIVRDAEWLYDHFVDHVVYSMLARDWPQGPPARAPGGR